MRCSHRSLLSTLKISVYEYRQEYSQYRTEKMIRRFELIHSEKVISDKFRSLDDQVHDAMTLVSSVAFSAGFIENSLGHVSICD